LIIMRGKSKSGDLYFYYLCRGRQARLGCDLPYFSVAKVEKAVAAHYATVRLTRNFCERAIALMDDAVESKQITALQFTGSIEKELAELDIREDRYLDLYGEGELPKAKLNERLKTIHDDRAKLQRQLDALQGELETGRAILISAMDLLDDPRALYEEAKTPARKVLNKAIFTKLRIDDLGNGPTVTGDELKEPFATVIYARRAEAGLERDEVRRAALEAVRAAEDEDIDTAETHNTGGNSDGETETLRWLEDELADVWARSESGNPSGLPRGLGRHRGDLPEEIAPDLTGAVLLTRSLVGACSSRTAMVPLVGVEPTLDGCWIRYSVTVRGSQR
ncbi:MAG: zinc ribbon domain-containing protein, partial [Pseudonocardiaceae bacterium]